MEGEYHRGRWEGRIEERVVALEEDLAEVKKLASSLNESLSNFNSANKEREAVSMAVADALAKLGKRWYDRMALLIAALSALAAVVAVIVSAFH